MWLNCSYLFFLSSYKNGKKCDYGWRDWVTHSVGPHTKWPHAQWTSITNKKWFQLFQIHYFTQNIVRRAYWYCYDVFRGCLLSSGTHRELIAFSHLWFYCVSECHAQPYNKDKQPGSQSMWREYENINHLSSAAIDFWLTRNWTLPFLPFLHFVVYFFLLLTEKHFPFWHWLQLWRKGRSDLKAAHCFNKRYGTCLRWGKIFPKIQMRRINVLVIAGVRYSTHTSPFAIDVARAVLGYSI